MRPRDWFDVGTRLVGVASLVLGLGDIVNAALFYAGYFQNLDMSFHFYLIAGWCSIAIGLLLIRLAPVIVNFAYGEDEAASSKSEEKPAESEENE